MRERLSRQSESVSCPRFEIARYRCTLRLRIYGKVVQVVRNNRPALPCSRQQIVLQWLVCACFRIEAQADSCSSARPAMLGEWLIALLIRRRAITGTGVYLAGTEAKYKPRSSSRPYLYPPLPPYWECSAACSALLCPCVPS